MAFSKFDLCKSEWLELVFDDRNQSYGAYDLRKHYADNLSKALGFTSLAFIGLFLGFHFFLTRQPALDPRFEVTLSHPIIAAPPKVKPVEPPKPRTEPPVQHQTVAFPPPVPVSDDIAKKMPTIDEAKLSVIGQTESKGPVDGGNLDDLFENKGTAATEDNSVKNIATVEIMPQFPGGEAAWSKFLQKNLHYPAQAIDAGISGKVFISFVVEKDGHLSNITVVRGMGYGLEEEAMRVLKLVPPWKPGIQNGQPVRVMYNMPFNFQIPPSE